MLDEFSLIQHFFSNVGAPSGAKISEVRESGISIGVGDDAAILAPSAGIQLVAATDTLVAGVHFPENADAGEIARRCLRVNLSDMAAMGAKPKWFLLALTLPESDEDWLKAFSAGLADDALKFGCSLVGGDTTRGPLCISITMLGEVPAGKALLRSGARPGDTVFVSGELGLAAAALNFLDVPEEQCEPWQRQLLTQYYRPEPQLDLGVQLQGLASAVIDVSDGLLADLTHIARASAVAAEVILDQLPVSSLLTDNFPEQKSLHWVLNGGDDYQLCFTVPEARLPALMQIVDQTGVAVSAIGKIVQLADNDQPKVVCFDTRGQVVEIETAGYRHF